MDTQILVNLAYIVAAILFVYGIKMLGKADTARSGNRLSAIGMALAVIVTLLYQGLDYKLVFGGIALGTAIGLVAAKRVQMTGMPELVALFNGFGGLASLLVGWAEYQRASATLSNGMLNKIADAVNAELSTVDTFTAGVIVLAILIGEIDEKTMGPTSLMAFRTAAASGVGFRHLVREDAETVGLLGSGGQAANQLLALATERPIKRVKVYSRDPANRRRFAETYGAKFDLDITPADAPKDVVRGVDVVVCATNTNVVLFDGDLLVPGQHVTGIIGSNIQLVKGGFLKQRRREIDDRTAERADVIATNLRESIITEEQGDLFEPIERGLISIDDVAELGEIAGGTRAGRTSDEQITYHKNNNGTGASEMALAMRAYVLAKADGRGTEIDLTPASDPA